jgi:hypothetical protein
MYSLVFSFLIMLAMIYMPLKSSAQIGEPCDYTDPFYNCPIDGGVLLLLAAGIGIRAKKKNK